VLGTSHAFFSAHSRRTRPPTNDLADGIRGGRRTLKRPPSTLADPEDARPRQFIDFWMGKGGSWAKSPRLVRRRFAEISGGQLFPAWARADETSRHRSRPSATSTVTRPLTLTGSQSTGLVVGAWPTPFVGAHLPKTVEVDSDSSSKESANMGATFTRDRK